VKVRALPLQLLLNKKTFVKKYKGFFIYSIYST
jgi:hypothetical protein